MRRYHAPPLVLVRAAAAALVLVGVLAGCSGEAPLPGDPLRLTTAALPDAVLGEPYRETLVAVGGLRPYDFRLDDGELPPGLALQGGLLLGTPERLGEFTFVVAVSDGSLASTFERFTVTVRDVPVPRVRLDVPPADVRGSATLVGRVENAASLRAIRVRLAWQDDTVTPAEIAVRPARDDVVVFWTADADGLAIDLAFLGEAFDGRTDLFRVDLDVAEPTRLGLDLEAESLYAGRSTYVSERVGARRPDPASDDAAEDASDAATDGSEVGGTPDDDGTAGQDTTIDDAPEDAP